jgi:hypothetical protein
MFTYKNIRKTQVTIHATVFQFSAKAILAKWCIPLLLDEVHGYIGTKCAIDVIE